MEAMLRQCRRRIMMAEVSARLREGIGFCLKCLVGIAGIFLLLRVLTYAMDWTIALNRGYVFAIATTFAVAFLIRTLVTGIRGEPVHPDHAAERLDLSQATHNRIATAIALLRAGDDSPFARAAIRDGFEHLERLQAKKPHLDVPPFPWHRAGFSLAAAVALFAAGLFLVPKTGLLESAGGTGVTTSAKTSLPPGSSTPVDPDKPAPRPADPAKTIPNERPALQPADTAAKPNAKRPEPDPESRSEGAVARHASGESRSSRSASNSSSAANGGGAKSEPGDNDPGKPPKPRANKRQTAGQPKADPQEEKKAGSIDARGSSGAGSMQNAQNEWSSDVKAKSDDSDDFQDEEEPDEEMDPDKQRLGAQPALKNRAARVSRELSLFTGTEVGNEQNRGRGGPGGQKKARGTATMIMGVPIPGFVRGRLLPGPTKSTQEEVEPSPVEGTYATANNLPQSTPEEEPQERYQPTAADSTRARDYLIQYHAEHEHTVTRTDGDK
jgi:hypothetical protein